MGVYKRERVWYTLYKSWIFHELFCMFRAGACRRDQIEGSLPHISIQSSHGRFFRAIGGDSGPRGDGAPFFCCAHLAPFCSAHNVSL